MEYKISISPRRLILRLLIFVLILTIISIGIQIGKYVFNYRADWTTMFNLDREMNLPSWYSTFTLAFCALLLRAIAIGKKIQQERFHSHWQLLSLIFWWLAVDELLSIHEILIIPDLANALRLPWFLHSLWVIPGTVIVVLFVRHFWKFTLQLPKRTKLHFMLAFVIYVGGVLCMEMVGSYFAELEGQQHLTYALLATLEEFMEMIGVIVFIYGLLSYIGNWQKEIQLQIQITGV